MDEIQNETITIRKQPAFFENTGVDAQALIRPSYWGMADNEEHTIGEV